MLTEEVEEKRMEGRMSKDGVDRGGGLTEIHQT